MTLGSAAMRAYSSMNALAMPISSRTAEESPSACFWANLPRILEERSATDWHTLASSADSLGSAGCIAHDAISAARALCAAGVVQVVQVGYRLAHREESLVGVERAAKQHAEEIARAAGFLPQCLAKLLQTILMMRLELRHARVSAAERLAMRGQHQDVCGQLAVARDRLEKQAQGIALGVDRPHADVGRDGRKQHVARDHHVERFAVEREVLRSVAVADESAPLVGADLHPVALDDAPVGEREFGHQLGVAVAASSHPGGALGIEPVLAEDVEHRFGGVARARGAHRVRGQVFPLRSPELGAEPLAQPGRVACVVRMVMRQDDSLYP